MYPPALLAATMLVIAVAHAVRPNRRWIPLLVVSSLVTLLMGALGFVTGLMATALAGVPAGEPAQRMLLSLVGFGESLANVALALGLCALGTMIAAVGTTRVALR